MRKWDYLLEDIRRSDLEKHLLELDMGGWELVTLSQHIEDHELFLVISKKPSAEQQGYIK